MKNVLALTICSLFLLACGAVTNNINKIPAGTPGDGANETTQSKTPKVLLVVIDVLRPDALKQASSPNFDKLKNSALYSDNVRMGYPTISRNGWTSILTAPALINTGALLIRMPTFRSIQNLIAMNLSDLYYPQ